ncbi:MAG: prolipoprotein diacylglyceryl transferase [Ruminococcaceae bacterium]|nr:prolipoprotein diacylglyceryl transferase [Oscillospiraceae bacterium]
MNIDPVVTPDSFPFEVRWYGLVIMLGMILGVIYSLRKAKMSCISTEDLLDYVLFAVPVGIICARLYYVLFNLSEYHSIGEVFAIWNGGLAIYGGIIGGFFTMLAVAKFKKMNFLSVIDCFAPGVMIGQILGRWGNFFNAEAYGALSHISFPFIGDIATPIFENDYIFRMVIENDRVGTIAVHPTFLYESLWNVAGLLLIHFYFKNKKFNGEIALIYASWYGFGRFFIEGLRTDSLTQGAFRVSQMLALACVIAGITLIIIGRQKAKSKAKELDEYISQFSEPSEIQKENK